VYRRVVVAALSVRYSPPRLFCLIVRRATVIKELSASLTAFSEGKAFATSGFSNTRFVLWRNSFKYFPRTPVPNEAREYSALSSSPLPFRIYHLVFLGHRHPAQIWNFLRMNYRDHHCLILSLKGMEGRITKCLSNSGSMTSSPTSKCCATRLARPGQFSFAMPSEKPGK
jgi:hypothetical protein